MCLSTVYKEKKDLKNKIMENVCTINLTKEGLVFTDLMDRKLKYNGNLIEANLVDGYVIVSKEK